MQLSINNITITEERFETHGDLVTRFRFYESEQNRIPPAFAWDQLLIALATFIAEYLGEKALDYLWNKKDQNKVNERSDVGKILTNLANEGKSIKIILETKAESEIVEQLEKQLPGIKIIDDSKKSQ